MSSSRVGDVVAAGVAALKADSALVASLDGAKVYTHVKEKTAPPFVLAMGGDEVPWVTDFAMGDNAGDNGARQVDFVAQVASTFPGSAEVDDLASRVMEVLTDADSWNIDGFQLAEFVRNAFIPPTDLMSDGVLWFVRLVTIRVSLV